jgi:hypothetical protein
MKHSHSRTLPRYAWHITAAHLLSCGRLCAGGTRIDGACLNVACCCGFYYADDQMQQQKRLLEMNALAAGTTNPLQSGPI